MSTPEITSQRAPVPALAALRRLAAAFCDAFERDGHVDLPIALEHPHGGPLRVVVNSRSFRN